MKESRDNQMTISIEIDELVAEGNYSNLVIVNHSISEFVLDFVNVMPGKPKSKVKSRVILAPQHAKRLLGLLSENLKKYEDEFGKIQDSEKQVIPLNFGPTGKA